MAGDERTVAFGYSDGSAAWWDIRTRRRQEFFNHRDAGLAFVAFSPDGKRFAVAGLNGLIRLWEVATREVTRIGLGYANSLHGLAFSPDSRRLITTGTSPRGLVKIWDVATGRDVATLPGEPGFFRVIGFSPDGLTLFAANIRGRTLFWRVPSWEEIEAAAAVVGSEVPGSPFPVQR
jgi:WD40 repeat protein